MNLGVEIEFTGITRDTAVKLLENLLQSKAEPCKSTTPDAYTYYRIKDQNDGYWRVVRDRSIRVEKSSNSLGEISEDNMDYMCEVVSPVLNGKTLQTLFLVVELFKASGGVVNDTCGIHVHVDALPMEETIPLLKRFIAEQDNIFSAFSVTDYRAKKYCKPYDSNLEVPYFDNQGLFLEWLGEHYPDKRYYAVNFYSLVTHRTIEFRLFNSTLDIKELAKIIKWVVNFVYPYNLDNDLKLTIESILLMEMK